MKKIIFSFISLILFCSPVFAGGWLGMNSPIWWGGNYWQCSSGVAVQRTDNGLWANLQYASGTGGLYYYWYSPYWNSLHISSIYADGVWRCD